HRARSMGLVAATRAFTSPALAPIAGAAVAGTARMPSPMPSAADIANKLLFIDLPRALVIVRDFPQRPRNGTPNRLVPPAAPPTPRTTLRALFWRVRNSLKAESVTAAGSGRSPNARNARHTEGPNDRTSQMRIAQIAPLIESVPPRLYGGTERIASYLCEE